MTNPDNPRKRQLKQLCMMVENNIHCSYVLTKAYEKCTNTMTKTKQKEKKSYVKYHEYRTFSAGEAYVDDNVCQRVVYIQRLTVSISKVGIMKYFHCGAIYVRFCNEERCILQQCEN